MGFPAFAPQSKIHVFTISAVGGMWGPQLSEILHPLLVYNRSMFYLTLDISNVIKY